MHRRITFLDVALVLFPLVLVLQVPVDPDLGWHLRVGQDLFSGIFPFRDTYSWSMSGYAWIDHEWLSDACMYLLNHLFGLAGVGVVYILIALSAYIVAARTGALISRHIPGQHMSTAAGWRLGMALVILAVIVNYAIISPRVQMITILGFALINYWLWQFMCGERKHLWVVPVAMCLWANLHGGEVMGLLQLGLGLGLCVLAQSITRLGETFPFSSMTRAEIVAKTRHLAIVFGASVLATLVNPYTYRVFEEAIRANLDSFARSQIGEWMPINFQNSYGLVVGAFVFLFLWWLLWKRATFSAWHLVLLPVYLYLGMTAIRHTTLLVIFIMPWLFVALGSDPRIKRFLDDTVERHFAIRRGPVTYYLYNCLIVMIPLALLSTCVFLFATVTLDASRWAQVAGYPRAAVAFLAGQVQKGDRLLNDYNWGGYLIWNLPDVPVYADGRMTFWKDDRGSILKEYDQMIRFGPNWLDLMQANRVTLILMPRDSQLAAGIGKMPGFQRIYEDDTAVVFRRPQ